MSDKTTIDEQQFVQNLIRVVRKIQRHLPNGKIGTANQIYYVKKLQPGDQLAPKGGDNQATQQAASAQDQGDQSAAGAEQPDAQEQPAQQAQAEPETGQTTEQPQDATDPETQEPEAEEPPPVNPETGQPEEQPTIQLQRMPTEVLEIPWDLTPYSNGKDPIPSNIRKKFSPSQRDSLLLRLPKISRAVPYIQTSDPVRWGTVENDLVDRIRTGMLAHMRLPPGKGANNTIYVKMETGEGIRYDCVLHSEGLIDQSVYDTFGEHYSLKREDGGYCKREVAAYEVSKCFGLDDMVPPTALRTEDPTVMQPMLPDDLIERVNHLQESLSRQMKTPADDIRKGMGVATSVQLMIRGGQSVLAEPWYVQLFAGQTDGLNRFFQILPENRRNGMIRAALFDFLYWTGDRSIANIIFSDEHPVCLTDNAITMPDPLLTGLLYTQDPGVFTDQHISATGKYPLLWSDPAFLLSIRGSIMEIKFYEAMAEAVCARVRGDMAVDLARAAIENEVPPRNVAGVLSRLHMLRINSRTFARDPLVAARYYARLASGEPQEGTVPGMDIVDEFSAVPDFVNEAMSKVMGRDYNFEQDMQQPEGGDDDSNS